jgi:hypothetical protein
MGTELSSSVPVCLKYGFTDWLEGQIGFDAIRQVDLGPAGISSRGDLFPGARATLPSISTARPSPPPG